MLRSEEEIGQLARDLLPILKSQVVVRYAVQANARANRSYLEFEADLLTICKRDDKAHLVRFSLEASARDQIGVSRSDYITYTAADSTDVPDALLVILGQWNSRAFGNWLQPTPFVGAEEMYLNGLPHTSIRRPAHSRKWGMLTGMLVAILGKRLQNSSGEYHIFKRFSAYAAQCERERFAR